jgi:integrase/recombinase XerD
LNNELTIKLVSSISNEYNDIPTTRLREIIEEVIYDYDIKPQERGLAVIDDMRDKILLYLATKKLNGLSDLTLGNYKRRLIIFSDYIRKDVSDITTMDIRRYLVVYGTQRKIQRSTMNTVISEIKSFFEWLVDEEYIIKNPMRQIKSTKNHTRVRKSLSEEELEKLRDACVTLRERAIIEMYYATGCRLSELISVNINDINWMELSFKVIGKGNKERIIYFTPRANLYLQKYLNDRKSTTPNSPLFIQCKVPFKRLSCKAVQNEVSGIAKRAGFERHIYPHLLRHTLATLALKHGASLTTIQATLGHSNPSTTVIYAQTDQENTKNEYRKYMGQ